jgi:hypothetical protein
METDTKDNSTGASNFIIGMLLVYIGGDGLYSFLATGKAYFGGNRLALYDSDAAAMFAFCLLGGIALIVSGYRRLVRKDIG